MSSPATETISPLLVRRMAAVLDLEASPLLEAGTLPPLWHWAVFTEDLVAQSDLADDGHARRDPAIPGGDLPRRMFAGGRLDVQQPLVIGEAATCTSAPPRATEKAGGQGRLVFVTHTDTITDPRGGRLHEQRDLVYLDRRGPVARPLSPDPVPSAPWQSALAPSPALLFRFSALTFNAHRIHYDHRYATEVEGYPQLVVHGPLLALALCELARARLTRPIAAFSFRARRPVLVTDHVALRGWPQGSGAALGAYVDGGEPAVTAKVVAGD